MKKTSRMANKSVQWTAVWRRWILAETPEDRAAALAMARAWSRASGEPLPKVMQ
jgi:hypothetical protein